MATLKTLLESIEQSEDGPQVAAIFDFDGTLIAGFSATVFIREQIRRGDLSPAQFVELMNAMAGFGLGRVGFSAMMMATAQFMRDMSEDDYRDMADELYATKIARLIYPESRALLQAHVKKGHTIAIISSATPYQVEPAARDLGIKHVLCTYLEVEDGKFTGGVVRPTCFGEGKVHAAEKLAAETGADLDNSFFYSDSTDDLQLLERVGLPRALNPSERLDRYATNQRWEVAHFGSRGRPTLLQYARSIAATSSLVTSFAAGLPVYALTGSRRKAVNFSISLFADTASALVGMDLNIMGEHNLWSKRPAVFIFNHQSKADVMIMTCLLRRDIAGVGKKEIRDIPVIGQVMEAGGVVLIDRENSGSAIEAMQPLVDVMRNEGKSVVLAPEGTRTISPRLNPFKKGAFHLAMQAGVPIVPVVIHNAGDVSPKGDFVFRPAKVDVEVLAPVDTTDWKKENIDEHVREVRNMFLEVLGQPLQGELDSDWSRTTKPATKKKATKKAKTQAESDSKKKTTTKKSAKKATQKTPSKSPTKKAVKKRTVKKKVVKKKTTRSKPEVSKP